MNKFYVYAYVEPQTHVKFYIGKGCGDRYKNIKSRKRNKHLYNKLNKLLKVYSIEDIVVFLDQNLTEQAALEYEINLISEIGRITEKTGPLLNITAGGEGDAKHARAAALKRVQNGTHNFYTMSRETRSRNSQLVQQRRLKNGTHPFQRPGHNQQKRKSCHITCSDGRSWIFESRQAAFRAGFPRYILDQAIKNNGMYMLKHKTLHRKKDNRLAVHFKQGDIIKVL